MTTPRRRACASRSLVIAHPDGRRGRAALARAPGRGEPDFDHWTPRTPPRAARVRHGKRRPHRQYAYGRSPTTSLCGAFLLGKKLGPRGDLRGPHHHCSVRGRPPRGTVPGAVRHRDGALPRRHRALAEDLDEAVRGSLGRRVGQVARTGPGAAPRHAARLAAPLGIPLRRRRRAARAPPGRQLPGPPAPRAARRRPGRRRRAVRAGPRAGRPVPAPGRSGPSARTLTAHRRGSSGSAQAAVEPGNDPR